MDGFSWLYMREGLIKFWNWTRTLAGYFVRFIGSPIVVWREKWRWNWKNQLQQSAGKSRPIWIWRGARRYALYGLPSSSVCGITYGCMAASVSLACSLASAWLACCCVLRRPFASNWRRRLRDGRWRQAIAAAAVILRWNWCCSTRSTCAALCTAVWRAATLNELSKRFK